MKANGLKLILLFSLCLLFTLPASSHDPITTSVTFNKEVIRILQKNCLGCHAAGKIKSDISLMTYEEARPWAKAIKEEVLEKRMPPYQAMIGYGDFQNPRFREAFLFYLSLFERGLAPPVGNTQMANLYQEFANGMFAVYVSGPWNIGVREAQEAAAMGARLNQRLLTFSRRRKLEAQTFVPCQPESSREQLPQEPGGTLRNLALRQRIKPLRLHSARQGIRQPGQQ